MNCLLIGLGSYAQSVYLKFLKQEKAIENVTIVDFASEQARIEQVLSLSSLKYDLLLLDNEMKHVDSLRQDVARQLSLVIEKQQIKKVIIATPQEQHKMYTEFCLKHDLDIVSYNSVLSPIQMNPFMNLDGQQSLFAPAITTDVTSSMQEEDVTFAKLHAFFATPKTHVNIAEREVTTDVLRTVQCAIAEKYDGDDFRFSVEALIKHKGKFLICRRNDDAKVAPGIWNVPAGKVQYDESLTDAIVRETLEETSLTLDHIQYLDYKFINNKHKRIVYTYFCEVHAIKAFTIDRSEFSAWHWIDADEVDNYESLSPHLKSWIKYLTER